MGLSPARKTAFKVVQRVREKDSFAAEAMQSAVSRAKLSPRDKAFATRLAYGTIATRGTLDELVATELSRPEDTLDEVKDALAIAAYELFFEGTEPYVVVNQGVDLVQFGLATKVGSKAYAKKLGGLSNAVLRRLSEKRDTLFPGGDPNTDVEAAARLHGHPVWLAQLLQSEYGVEAAQAIMVVNNEPAPLYVAHLPFLESEKQSLAALTEAGISFSSAGIEGAFCIEDRAQFWALDVEKRKSFAAMDLAAQQVVALCRAQPDQKILEVGSGRGTKSLALAANARRQGGPASITGIDLYDFKTQVAQKTAVDYGVREAHYLTLDVLKHSAADGLSDMQFDTVLVDAPCSGLGTLRRGVDKRWKLSTDDISQLAKLGLHMLKWSSKAVVTGGTLIFATCTIGHVENQSVIKDFLASPEGQNFSVEPLEISDVADVFASAITSEGYLNALPQSGGPDGHFATRMRKG